MAKRTAKKKRIGFIGLGLMGSAFSRNLIADGHDLLGTDPSPAARARFRKMGGRVLASPRETAEEADVLFISVPNSKISHQPARGREGFLAFAEGRAPEAVVETTTVDPEEARKLDRMCRRKKVPFLEACVSGNSRNVEERKGLFLVGGEEKTYRRLAPLFGRMLSDQAYCGRAGAGATLKVVINYLACLERCAISEALRLGLRAGVAGDLLLDVLQRSAADSRQLRNRGPRMLKRRYTRPESTLNVLLKDIRLGAGLARRVGAITPIGRASLPLFEEARRSGYGEMDSAAVYQALVDREGRRGRAKRKARRAK